MTAPVLGKIETLGQVALGVCHCPHQMNEITPGTNSGLPLTVLVLILQNQYELGWLRENDYTS